VSFSPFYRERFSIRLFNESTERQGYKAAANEDDCTNSFPCPIQPTDLADKSHADSEAPADDDLPDLNYEVEDDGPPWLSPTRVLPPVPLFASNASMVAVAFSVILLLTYPAASIYAVSLTAQVPA